MNHSAKKSETAVEAGHYTLGLLNPDQRRQFLEMLGTSPRARSELDTAEALAAEIARQAPPVRPGTDVLTKALARIQTGVNAGTPEKRKLWKQIPLAWVAAGVTLLSGSYGLWHQHETIVTMEQRLATQARAHTSFPPGNDVALSNAALKQDESPAQEPGADPSQATGNQFTKTPSITPLVGKERSVLRAVQGATVPEPNIANQPQQNSKTPLPGAVEGSKVASVFVELRGPEERVEDKAKHQISKMVEDYMTAAAKAIDSEQEVPKPAIIGGAAEAGSFELYEGIWDLGEGILFSQETGLLMVPRGDGRTYDYRKPGPGFDLNNIPATRQRVVEDARQQAISSAQAEREQSEAGTGLPRAYIYADSQSGEGFVVVKRLPELQDGEVYRLYQNTASPELIGDLPPGNYTTEEAVLKLPTPSAAGEGFILTRKNLATPSDNLGEVILRGK